MADEKKEVFDVESAASLMKELRGSFNAGKTKSYEWRISQLKRIKKMIDEREKEIIEALQEDLSKPEYESFVAEVLHSLLFLLSLDHIIYLLSFVVLICKMFAFTKFWKVFSLTFSRQWHKWPSRG